MRKENPYFALASFSQESVENNQRSRDAHIVYLCAFSFAAVAEARPAFNGHNSAPQQF